MNAANFKVCVFSSPFTGNLVQFRLSPEQVAEADTLGISHMDHAKALYRAGLKGGVPVAWDTGGKHIRVPDAGE